MAHARWSTTGTEAVAQDLVDPTDSEREQFRCWYCHDVPVQFVKGGRTRNDILIRPHFRRHPTYPTHGPDCGFDFDVQFERWGQRAAEIITKSKRRIVLTLDHLVPDYSAPVPPPATADGQPNQPTTPTTPSRHLPRLQQERLQRLTCEAARDLWHLACLVEDDGAMRDRVILKLGNRAIDWSEFFFRHDVDGDLERLARMVQLQGEVPACIVGRVHQVIYDIAPKESATASGSKTGASRKRLYDRIDLVWAKMDANRHLAIHIGSRSPGIFSEIDTGDEVVVSGKVERQRFTNVLAGPRKVSAWCWLNNPAQVALRDDGGAAQPLPG
jgi:hypothetical protein